MSKIRYAWLANELPKVKKGLKELLVNEDLEDEFSLSIKEVDRTDYTGKELRLLDKSSIENLEFESKQGVFDEVREDCLSKEEITFLGTKVVCQPKEAAVYNYKKDRKFDQKVLKEIERHYAHVRNLSFTLKTATLGAGALTILIGSYLI